MPDEGVLAARAEDLRRWRAEYPDTVPIADVQPRRRSVVVGVVFKVRLERGRSFEAVVEDGSGRLAATWIGRSHLPGIELGTGLRLEGTVAVDRDGTLRMRNPEYELVAEPYR